MKIAVLGGGHGSYAAAADLAEQGHEVRLWRRDAAALEPVRIAGSIGLRDEKGSRRVPIACATADIGEAVRGAELLLLPSPATSQDDIASAIAPHLSDGQVAFLPPGTFGSVVMARRTAASRTALALRPADVLWAETGTLPYLARKRADDEVAITIRAVRLPTGVYPARRADEALAVIRRAYPSVLPCGDAMSGALMNAGPVIHPPLILMNAAPLQHFERWDIHAEGTQACVRAVTDALDAERIAVREALGYGAPHFPLRDHYTSDRWMYGDAHKRLVDSGDWREHIDLHTHRYMTEDTVMGLAFLASVARWAGVDAPVTSGLLAIAGAILGRDLRRGPRTLEALGLAASSGAQLRERLHEGGV
jgi:opine dehydrogenase